MHWEKYEKEMLERKRNMPPPSTPFEAIQSEEALSQNLSVEDEAVLDEKGEPLVVQIKLI